MEWAGCMLEGVWGDLVKGWNGGKERRGKLSWEIIPVRVPVTPQGTLEPEEPCRFELGLGACLCLSLRAHRLPKENVTSNKSFSLAELIPEGEGFLKIFPLHPSQELQVGPEGTRELPTRSYLIKFTPRHKGDTTRIFGSSN